MKVAVLMGSASDKAKMAPASEMLAQLGVDAVEEVMSAHRTPEVVAGFAGRARRWATASSSAAPVWPPIWPERWRPGPRCP